MYSSSTVPVTLPCYGFKNFESSRRGKIMRRPKRTSLARRYQNGAPSALFRSQWLSQSSFHDIWKFITTAPNRISTIPERAEKNCHLLGQRLIFKLFGITYLIGKISRSNGFISGFHSLSEAKYVLFNVLYWSLPQPCFFKAEKNLQEFTWNIRVVFETCKTISSIAGYCQLPDFQWVQVVQGKVISDSCNFC